MASFDLDKNAFIREARTAMLAGVQIAHTRIVQMTPRDPLRLPQNPSARVTWNLRRSVQYEEKGKLDFIIWVVRGPTEEYAWAQEFGTNHIPARSYLRRGIIQNSREILRTIESVFSQLTSK